MKPKENFAARVEPLRLLDRFIPPEDRVGTPIRLIRAQFLVVLAFLTSFCSFLITGLVLLFQPVLAPSFPFIVLLGFATGALPFLYRRFGRVQLWSTLVLLATKIPVSLVTFYSGGFFSAALVLNVLLPFIASILLNARAGVVAAAVIVAEVQLFYWLQRLEVPLPAYDRPSEIWFESITLSIVVGILLFIAFSVDRMRERASRMQSQLERELVVARRLAELGELSGQIAHELNNPLSYTIANLEQLAFELKRSEPSGSMSESVNDALDGALTVSDQIQRLLRRVQSERARIDSADLVSVVDRAVDTAVALADETKRPRVVRSETLPRVRGHSASLDPLFFSVALESIKQLEGEMVVVLEEEGHWVRTTFRRVGKRARLRDGRWSELQLGLDAVGAELTVDTRGGEVVVRIPRA